MERDQTLFARGALSKSQTENTATKYAEAKGKLEALDAQINAARAQKMAVASQKEAALQNVALWKVRNQYAEVTAPVSGVISARLQEPGNYVTPNSPLYQLEDTHRYRLNMQVPQQYAAELAVGEVVTLLLPTGLTGPRFSLTRLFPAVNEQRQRTIEAETGDPLENAVLEQQFSAEVVIASASGLVIPKDAYSFKTGESGNNEYAVYLVQGKAAVRKTVTPRIVSDSGDIIVGRQEFPAGSKLIRLGFMQAARLPETISLEGASK